MWSDVMQHELLTEARAILSERRSSVLNALRTEQHREGVFMWLGGPPTAGQQATLVYNKNCGALRSSQVTYCGVLAAVVHHKGCASAVAHSHSHRHCTTLVAQA